MPEPRVAASAWGSMTSANEVSKSPAHAGGALLVSRLAELARAEPRVGYSQILGMESQAASLFSPLMKVVP